MEITATNANCHVFTKKDGLLARVAHDLKLAVGRFRIGLDKDQLRGALDVSTLKVVCAQVQDRDAPGLLSERDLRQIHQHLADDVLEVSRYPEVVIEAAFGLESLKEFPARQSVSVTMKGVTRAVPVILTQESGDLVGRAKVFQPDFGIRPFSAMFGTLKIQPEVVIELRVPTSSLRA